MTTKKTTFKGWASAFAGTVLDVQRWTETHVSTSGGYTYTANNQVYQTPVQVNVSNEHRQRVYVRSESGREDHFEVGQELAFRVGSKFAAVWGSPVGAKQGDYLILKNEDTGKFLAEPKRHPGGYGMFNGLFIGVVSWFLIFIVASALLSAARGSSPEQRRDIRALSKEMAELSVRSCTPGKSTPKKNPRDSDYNMYMACEMTKWHDGRHVTLQFNRVKLGGGRYGCQCPTAAEAEKYAYQSLQIANSLQQEKQTEQNSKTAIGIAFIGSLLVWIVAGGYLATRRKAERDQEWEQYLKLVEQRAAEHGLVADTSRIESDGLRVSRA